MNAFIPQNSAARRKVRKIYGRSKKIHTSINKADLSRIATGFLRLMTRSFRKYGWHTGGAKRNNIQELQHSPNNLILNCNFLRDTKLMLGDSALIASLRITEWKIGGIRVNVRNVPSGGTRHTSAPLGRHNVSDRSSKEFFSLSLFNYRLPLPHFYSTIELRATFLPASHKGSDGGGGFLPW
jgi:hypothetical protein